MELLIPGLILLAVLILVAVGAVMIQNARLRRRLVARAQELLSQGAALADAQQQLVGEGVDAEQAMKLVVLAVRQIHVDEAVEMLETGKTEDEVMTSLRERGMDDEQTAEITGLATFQHFCRRHPLLTTMLGVVLPLVGLAVLGGGVFLWIGNRSGKSKTFPFAGQLTMIVGVSILAVGGRFFLGAVSF